MNDTIVLSSPVLSREITLPPSKSLLHRVLICSAVCERATDVLFYGDVPDDVLATVRCLNALGASVERTGQGLRVLPVGADVPERFPLLDCGESATTLRMLLPVAAALGRTDARFIRRGSLASRPVFGFAGLCTVENNGFLETSLPLKPGSYTVDATQTSQTVSGMLTALAICGGESRLCVPERVSSPYIEMTINVLESFGAGITRCADTYLIRGVSRLRSPGSIRIGGDWSAAAFVLCGGLISGGEVILHGIDESGTQGDRVITDIIKAYPSPFVFGAENNPDLVPPLAALACFSRGESLIKGAERLKNKESNRLGALCKALGALGADIAQTTDGLVIRGKPSLEGGAADSAKDHRIAMAAGIAALGCRGSVTVLGSSCVAKSWKGFWDIFYEKTRN